MGGSCSCPMKLKLFKKFVKKSEDSGRTILVNCNPSQSDEVTISNKQFGNNRIITSHYTWWNFFFINLFEQFHVIANFFFLLICILYFFGETPINPITTIGPLVIVVAISMVKDGVDDIKRHKADHDANKIPFRVLQHQNGESHFVKKHSEDIRCGDIVICEENVSFPCDLLLLASSNSSGKVFVTTDNLDGESSVKTTFALSCTQSILAPLVNTVSQQRYEDVKVGLSSSTIVCQSPCEDLKFFEGSLQYDGENVPLVMNNMALRGANLRHTDFIIGVAVYTGGDTKLSLNGKPGFRKFSSSARRFNVILLIFVVAMFVVTLLMTILQFVWRGLPYGSPWYFYFPPVTAWRRVQEYLTTLFIINYLIPISIMVTMELQQLVLAVFISQDVEFYDPESDEKAQVNATNIADELGQIEFLFSDKTGTLTQNKMVFKSYGLANDRLVYSVEDAGLFAVRRDRKSTVTSDSIKKSSLTQISQNDYFSSEEDENAVDEDTDLNETSSEGRRKPPSKHQIFKLSKEAEMFWLNVALCHSIEAKVTQKPDTKEEVITYNAASPDEKALVDAAAKVGFIYLGVDDTVNKEGDDFSVHLVRFDPSRLTGRPSSRRSGRNNGTSVQTTVRRYRMDAVLEFNSVRKRMSVMVRDEKKRCFVFTKGAEVSMLDPRRCGKTASHTKDDIIRKVTDFALSGLRTLVFGMRELDTQTYEDLLKQLREAQCQIGPERAAAVEEASARIERNMTLIAVSAVEDKLQPGVKKTLQSLISAGIQVWVLTGDKEETAVQISQATGHFPPGTTLVRLTNGQSVEEVGRAIYVQQEGMQARLEHKHTWRRLRSLFRSKTSLVTVTKSGGTTGTDSESSSSEVELKKTRERGSLLENVRSALAGGLRRHRRRNPGGANEPVGLVIDGTTLRYAISPVLRDQFLRLCMNVTTVLCCRMTPLQKAAVVRLVSRGLDGVGGGGRPVTAAVGDGGNDVAMLHEASVGIGIFGNEGRQAVRASDFAIPLFKHLGRLFLVHGDWNYYRISMTANIFYFKNVAFVAVQVYQMFYDGFSGQSMFDSLLYTLYNLTFTSYLPFVFGLFDQHVSANDLMHRPYLYRLQSQAANLRAWYVILWVLDGWWHGTVVYYICQYFLVGGMYNAEASFRLPGTSYATVDYNMFGNACFIFLVVTTTMRIVVAMHYLTLPVILGTVLTGLGNLAVMFIYQSFGSTSSYVYMNYVYLGNCPAFWLSLLLVLALSLLPDILWRVMSDAWWDYQIALSGVKRLREKRKRHAWQKFVSRSHLED